MEISKYRKNKEVLYIILNLAYKITKLTIIIYRITFYSFDKFYAYKKI